MTLIQDPSYYFGLPVSLSPGRQSGLSDSRKESRSESQLFDNKIFEKLDNLDSILENITSQVK